MEAETTVATILGIVGGLTTGFVFWLRERGKAARIAAEAEKIRAKTDQQEAEDTGRVIVGAEANAETIREMFKEIRMRLDRCEKRHDERDKKDAARDAAHLAEVAAKDKTIGDLMKQVRGLGEEVDELRGMIGQPPRMRMIGSGT